MFFPQDRSGAKGFKEREVDFSEINSETNLPVAGPKLQPIIECPVANTKLETAE